MQRKAVHPVSDNQQRRGVMIVLVGLLLTIIFFFAALVVDHGYTSVTKARLQTAADAATLAGIDVLADERRLQGTRAAERVAERAIDAALQVVELNWPPEFTFDAETDVQIMVGKVDSDGEFQETEPADATSMSVNVITTDASMFFAPVFGVRGKKIDAAAVASFDDQIMEIRINTPGTRSPVLPIALHIDRWKETLDGYGPDRFAWDDKYREVCRGADDLNEHDAFSGDANSSGNFGTLKIGRTSNGIQALADQIVNGLTEQHLAPFGGALALDPRTKTLVLDGDPGMGGPVYDAAYDIIGETRLVPLFSKVEGNGANTRYTIVGFAGVRIVDANKSGGNKYIKVQPANVRHDSFVTGDSGFESWGTISAPQFTK